MGLWYREVGVDVPEDGQLGSRDTFVRLCVCVCVRVYIFFGNVMLITTIMCITKCTAAGRHSPSINDKNYLEFGYCRVGVCKVGVCSVGGEYRVGAVCTVGVYGVGACRLAVCRVGVRRVGAG